jgi:hypothetical protein
MLYFNNRPYSSQFFSAQSISKLYRECYPNWAAFDLSVSSRYCQCLDRRHVLPVHRPLKSNRRIASLKSKPET